MDNSFVQRLRMNNIYPSAGNNPFGPPDMNSGMGDFTALLNQLLTHNSTVQKPDEPFHPYDIHGTGQPGWGPGALGKVAEQARTPMNVVEDKSNKETKYQKDLLDFKNRELASKDELGQQKVSQTGDLGQQKIDVSREGLKAKTEQNKASNKIKQEMVDIADFKAKHPGMKPLVKKGGNFMMEDPITGKIFDSGVGTGTLSDADLVEAKSEAQLANTTLQGQNRMEQIGAQGENQLKNTELQGSNQRDVQGMRGEQAITNIGARGEVQRGLLDTRGEQNLAEIAARAREQRDTNAAKPSTGTTTTSEKVTPAKSNIFGSENPLFGGAPEKKVITTTKKEPTANAKPAEAPLPTKPPAGAKKGQWVRTKYGPAWLED